MALGQDHRAMLQLLLERGQSYDDIASLLGVSVDDARGRARSALTELAGRDPDGEVALTDYLLGQADPIGRADVARHLRTDDQALELATELELKLRAIAPDAELPTLPSRRGKKHSPMPAAAESTSEPGRASTPGLSSSRRKAQIAGLLVGALAIAVAVILIVAGVFDGGETVTDSASTGGADSAGVDASADELLATVELDPQGGSNGSGLATFGIASQDQPYLDLTLERLRPAPSGRTYVLWLLVDGERGHPLTPLEIPESGDLDQRFPIDGSTVVIAAATQQVDVALAENDQLAAVIQRAANRGDAVIRFTGQSVLRGRVPLSDQVAPDGGGGATPNGQGGENSR